MNFLKTTPVLVLLLFLPQVAQADSIQIAPAELNNIETNFYIAKLVKYDFPSGRSLLVQSNQNHIYIGDRTARLIYKINNLESSLEIENSFKLPEPSSPGHPDNVLLDIYANESHLYAAVGDGSRSSKVCGGILIYDFLIKLNGDLDQQPRIIFRSTPCVQGDTGGHLWTARLAGDGENIYIAGGNWLVDWQYGTFPWSGFTNLGGMKKVPATNFYGKITKINLKTRTATVFASGIRNLGGLYFDFSRKILVNSDNGTRGGDRLNLVVKNSDFGWPRYSLGLPYSSENSTGAVVNSLGNSTPPLLAWLPSISPSTISTVKPNGNFSKYWEGDLIVGSLKDLSLHRIRLSRKNSFIYDERIRIGYRIRSHSTLPDGRIIIATDSGEILILSEESQKVSGNFPAQ